MKEKINTAQHEHKDKTGEIISKTYIAAVMFPDSRIETARMRLNNLMNDKTRVNVEHIKTLCEIFPLTNYNYWLS